MGSSRAAEKQKESDGSHGKREGGRTSEVDLLIERDGLSLLEDLEDRVVENDPRVVENLVGSGNHA